MRHLLFKFFLFVLMTLIASIITFSKKKNLEKKMLPSTLDMAPSPSTWHPRPSTLDKKIDSRSVTLCHCLAGQSFQAGVQSWLLLWWEMSLYIPVFSLFLPLFPSQWSVPNQISCWFGDISLSGNWFLHYCNDVPVVKVFALLVPSAWFVTLRSSSEQIAG